MVRLITNLQLLTTRFLVRMLVYRQVFANKAMATREHLERQVQTWLEAEGGVLPPGNDAGE
jgi:hypothetical protein